MPQHNSLLFQQKTNNRRKRFYSGVDLTNDISPLIGRLSAYCISDRINLIILQDYLFSTFVSSTTKISATIDILEETGSNVMESEIHTYQSPRESFLITLNNKGTLKAPLLAMVEKPKEDYFGFTREILKSPPYDINETGFNLSCDPTNWIKLLGKNISMFLDGDMLCLYENIDDFLKKQIYIFEFGCVIFFNFNSVNESLWIERISCLPCIIFNKCPIPFKVQTDTGVIGYDRTISKSLVDVLLPSKNVGIHKKQIMLTAHCWSRSVKLQLFEFRVSECIENSTKVLTMKDLNQLLGYLHLETQALNVSLDVGVGDTPDFIYYDAPELEEEYWALGRLLELNKRSKLLNQRLDLLKKNSHSGKSDLEYLDLKRLEWIVVWLIVFQIVLYVVWEILVKNIFHLLIDKSPLSL